MKLLLCSDFSGIGYMYLNEFFSETKGLTALFVGYATEDEFEEESGSVRKLQEMGVKVVFLKENYRFNDKIDMIFVRGGNTTRLIHFLRKFNQYEKIKQLAENGAVYIGSSAGSVLVGSDTEYTLRSEPYEYDLKQIYGKNALNGFGWIDKLVFVHASRYRICWTGEMENENDVFKTIDTFCYPAYLSDVRKYNKDEFIKIANNEVLIINGDKIKRKKYNLKDLPLKIVGYENDA